MENLKKQLLAHKREPGIKTIVLNDNPNITLELQIKNGVFGSDLLSAAINLAKFLYMNQKLFQNIKRKILLHSRFSSSGWLYNL